MVGFWVDGRKRCSTLGRAGSPTSKNPQTPPRRDARPGIPAFRPDRAPSRKPLPASGSKIFQPTDSRQSGPEFGPAPRSSGGAPGHRGGWKKRQVDRRSLPAVLQAVKSTSLTYGSSVADDVLSLV